MGINNVLLQWGYYDTGSSSQVRAYTTTFPMSYTNSHYSVIVTAADDGSGIPCSKESTVSSVRLVLKGPWQDWPSRSMCWIIIGY